MDAGSGAMEPVEHPNVLLILIDGLRADHVGCYGFWKPRTGFSGATSWLETWRKRPLVQVPIDGCNGDSRGFVHPIRGVGDASKRPLRDTSDTRE